MHLIHPLGFSTDEKTVRRAGLDYWPHVSVFEYADWETFLREREPKHLYLFENRAPRTHAEAAYETPAYLVLGSEVTSIPVDLLERYADRVHLIPMRTDIVRSLNLSQAAAIVLYEAMRQHSFPGVSTET